VFSASLLNQKDCFSITMPSTTQKAQSLLPFAKDHSKRPYGLKWRSNTLFIVATVGIGLFTDLFLYALVVPILPSILRDKVGVPDKDIQSDVSGLLAAYAAASVITSPFAGVIADRLSSRRAQGTGKKAKIATMMINSLTKSSLCSGARKLQTRTMLGS
jgi:predicted MFS family arabinose efflux permease